MARLRAQREDAARAAGVERSVTPEGGHPTCVIMRMEPADDDQHGPGVPGICCDAGFHHGCIIDYAGHADHLKNPGGGRRATREPRYMYTPPSALRAGRIFATLCLEGPSCKWGSRAWSGSTSVWATAFPRQIPTLKKPTFDCLAQRGSRLIQRGRRRALNVLTGGQDSRGPASDNSSNSTSSFQDHHKNVYITTNIST